uniref:Uncharacterized protein n=1 Tax=Anguilla anguilla TaxID=7936 RepID=A0A0E9SJU1_ANGAN
MSMLLTYVIPASYDCGHPQVTALELFYNLLRKEP